MYNYMYHACVITINPIYYHIAGYSLNKNFVACYLSSNAESLIYNVQVTFYPQIGVQ